APPGETTPQRRREAGGPRREHRQVENHARGGGGRGLRILGQAPRPIRGLPRRQRVLAERTRVAGPAGGLLAPPDRARSAGDRELRGGPPCSGTREDRPRPRRRGYRPRGPPRNRRRSR